VRNLGRTSNAHLKALQLQLDYSSKS